MAQINVHLDKELEDDVREIAESQGVKIQDLVRMFFRKVREQKIDESDTLVDMIDIDEEIWESAKKQASSENKAIDEIITEALEKMLNEEKNG